MRDTLVTRLARAVANSRRVERMLATNPGLEELVDRFLAGEHPADAVVVALDRLGKGIDVSFAQTRDHAESLDHAQAVADAHLDVARQAHLAGIDSFDVSVSLAALGLGLGAEGALAARQHADRIATEVERLGGTVTLEQGRSPLIDDVLDIGLGLRADHPTLGLTVQGWLRRTPDDLRMIIADSARIRLCKGAYAVPEVETWPTQHQADRAFVLAQRQLFESPAYPMVATHDARLVSITHELVRRSHRTRDDYEFQMLMGVRSLEHRRLVDTGRRLRVQIPYGKGWFGYVGRRLTENPQTLGKVARQLVSRR